MRNRSHPVLGLLIACALVVGACAPAAPTTAPTASAAKPTEAAKPAAAPTTAPAAKPTEAAKPAAGAATAPAAKPTTAPAKTTALSAAEWNQVVEAAKREGQIVVLGPQGDGNRTALVEEFQKAYPGIEVDFSGLAGAAVAPKVTAEQGANQFRNDLVIAGTSTIVGPMMPTYLTPMQPYMVGPNSGDPSVWLGGDYPFADEAKQYNIIMSAYPKETFVYNVEQVNPAEFHSAADLLNPKWKGKIVAQNPTVGGPTSAQVLWAYISPQLGKEFIRRFWQEMDVTILANSQQAVDGVIQGKWAIGYGLSNSLINESLKKGLPLGVMNGHPMTEGTYMTAGSGSVAILRNPPHPNATKVYLEWLSTVEGQTAWAHGHGFASLRKGTPVDHILDQAFVPREGVTYINTGYERYINMGDEFQAYLETVMP